MIRLYLFEISEIFQLQWMSLTSLDTSNIIHDEE